MDSASKPISRKKSNKAALRTVPVDTGGAAGMILISGVGLINSPNLSLRDCAVLVVEVE